MADAPRHRLVTLARRVEQFLVQPRFAAMTTAIVAVIFAARCLHFVLVEHPPGRFVFSDMSVYEARALHIMSGQLDGWDTFTPPGYPALIALVYSVVGHSRVAVGVLQALMAGGSVAVVHRLGLRVAGGIGALVAAVLVAVNIPTVYYTGFLLSETPFTFLFLLGILLVVRGTERDRSITLVVAGLVLGAAAVVRPNLLAVVPLAPVFLWVMSARRGKVAARWALLVAVGAAPPIAVATHHNSRIIGAPASLATNGGLNFYLNFSEIKSIRYRNGRRVDWIAPIPNLERYTRDGWTDHPFYEDRYFYSQGLARIREHPLRLVRALDNLREGAGLGKQSYWPPWSGHDRSLTTQLRLFFAWGIVPALLYAGYLLVSRRAFRREHAVELALMLALVSVIVTLWLFLGDPRVRVPFDPMLILLGVAGVTRLVRFVARRVAAGESPATASSSPDPGAAAGDSAATA